MGLFRKTKLPLDVVIAADKGDPRAKEQLRKAFAKGMTEDEHNRLRWQAYSIPANQGDAFAQYWLGFLYSMDKRDPECAAYWFELSAQQGNVDAMKDLAFGYGEFLNTSGLTYGPVPLGYDEAKELYWLKMAANCGDEKSQEELESRGIL